MINSRNSYNFSPKIPIICYISSTEKIQTQPLLLYSYYLLLLFTIFVHYFCLQFLFTIFVYFFQVIWTRVSFTMAGVNRSVILTSTPTWSARARRVTRCSRTTSHAQVKEGEGRGGVGGRGWRMLFWQGMRQHNILQLPPFLCHFL